MRQLGAAADQYFLENGTSTVALTSLIGSAAYVKAQLQAFASGARRNDISQQMRNVARRMTPEEIDQAAEWYASQPSTNVHTR